MFATVFSMLVGAPTFMCFLSLPPMLLRPQEEVAMLSPSHLFVKCLSHRAVSVAQDTFPKEV